MPELPEVETIACELRPLLVGRSIQQVHCLHHACMEPSYRAVAEAACGVPIRDLFRRGKYLCFQLDNGTTLTLHLRMTGKVLFAIGEKERRHVRLRLLLDDGRILFFVDARKFGRLKLWPNGKPLLPSLGPEPLKARTVRHVLQKLKSRRSIKSVLLDQSVLAGIGNIYADEALHLSGIHPQNPLARLAPTQIKRLSDVIPKLLFEAIQRQGTTLSDYRTTRNLPGQQQHYLRIYGRVEEPCYTCGQKIRRIRIAGRSAYLCPFCQKESSLQP